MAVPLFVQAGSGVFVPANTATAVTMGGVTTGNLVMVHYLRDGAVGTSHNAYSGVETLAGTDNSLDSLRHQESVGTTGAHSVWVGRSIGSTASITLFNASNDLFARWYEFSGASLGTTVATVFEDGAGTSGIESGSASTTITDEDLTTNGADRLGCQFIATNSTTTLGDFTGEGTVDWTEAVAEFASTSGSLGTLGLQTGTIASAGTYGGGTITITSADWGLIGTAIIPAASTALSHNIMTLGVS